jgi:hypothetical protein
MPRGTALRVDSGTPKFSVENRCLLITLRNRFEQLALVAHCMLHA